ncbi:hypothetical protein CASFOL_021068 [Castilleja foliolosa]|uniref:Uncharacterized protein n=1 Tax=Castilleja foliolosa TaxID=1961234 RepID=A0ABD3CY09_9LAMI
MIMNNFDRVTVFLFACVQVITLAAGDLGTATPYGPPYTLYIWTRAEGRFA